MAGPQQTHTLAHKITVILFLAIVSGIAAIAFFLATAPQTPPCDDTVKAYIVSQSIISEEFPDPGATRFLPSSDKRASVKKTGDCSFLIAARVDYPGERAGTLEGWGYSMDLDLMDVEAGRYRESNVTLDRRTRPVTNE